MRIISSKRLSTGFFTGLVLVIAISLIFLFNGNIKVYADDTADVSASGATGLNSDCSQSNLSSTESSEEETSAGSTNISPNNSNTTDDSTSNPVNTDCSSDTASDTTFSLTLPSSSSGQNTNNNTASTSDNDENSSQVTNSNSDSNTDSNSTSNTNNSNSEQCESSDPDNQTQSTSETENSSATIDNCDQQSADSGQANVDNGGNGGTATSGNADDSINEVNEETNSDSTSSQPVDFTDNIYGNQTGNIEIDPSTITSQQSTDNTTTDNETATSTTTNNSTINNTDEAVAQTGDATVTNDGEGGTAASGNAEALANVVNIINSVIADGESFEGTINIYGNLYGDILLPEQLVDELINPATIPSGTDTDNTETGLIDNDVELTAESGSALVTNDGDGGTAASGNATTDLNITNYVNDYLSADNLFLIIINVSGQWYGYILGEVPESDVALLGDGLSNSNVTQSQPSSTEVNDDTETINNDISSAAYTGSATVNNDGNGGTATSGDAEALANILNFINDNFNISGWFGILFINIFGNWYGSLSTYNANPTLSSETTGPTPIGVNDNSPSNSRNTTSALLNPTYISPINQVSYGGYWVEYTNYTIYYPVTYTNYTTSVVKKIVTVTSLGKNISNSTTNKNTDPQKRINYWLALLSLIPIAGLIAVERKGLGKKQ